MVNPPTVKLDDGSPDGWDLTLIGERVLYVGARINTLRTPSEDHPMRYYEFAPADLLSRDRLNTVTLYLSDEQEWQRLDALRRSYGPTEITGRRELAPAFGGWSVDVLCSSRDEADQMLGNWCREPASRGRE